jgi:phage gpG-like protein
VVSEPLITIKAAADLDGRFKRALREAGNKIGDLSVPLSSIRASWYRSNNAIFALKSAGKYDDLSEAYKKAKQKQVGFVYPILERSGLLKSSITDPTHKDAIGRITSNKQGLEVGTKVPYGIFHQMGTVKMPQRQFLFAGAEQVAPDAINKRLAIWTQIIEDWVAQVTAPVGELK